MRPGETNLGKSSTGEAQQCGLEPHPLARFTTAERLAEARRLTSLMQAAASGFSFVRLSDGEIRWILDTLVGVTQSLYREVHGGTIEHTNCTAGFEPRHLQRFLRAYNLATFVDFCENTPYVAANLPKVPLQRPADALRNQSPETSNIFFEWCAFELKDWLATHRCLFYGAESALLAALWHAPEFQAAAASVLDFSRTPVFVQPRDDGRRYSENLDLLKQDLAEEIQGNDCDTVFISLGSGAKILATEIASELKVACFDFGSLTRALCYSGTAGYQSVRQTHNPFLYHVPFRTWLEALDLAHSNLQPHERIGKVHCQLALELHRHLPLKFNPSDGRGTTALDLSAINLRRFREGYRHYRRHVLPAASGCQRSMELHRAFEHWRRKHGVNLDGQIYRGACRLKQSLDRLFRKTR